MDSLVWYPDLAEWTQDMEWWTVVEQAQHSHDVEEELMWQRHDVKMKLDGKWQTQFDLWKHWSTMDWFICFDDINDDILIDHFKQTFPNVFLFRKAL